MKIFLLAAAFAVLSAAPALAAARPAKGRSGEVSIYGDRVSFFFSMKEEKPEYPEDTVVWQRWQLSCNKGGTCTGLIFYKLSDGGAGTPCSVSMDSHESAKFETVRLDLAAGEAVVKVDDYLLGAGDLRIRFDPKTLRIRTAEVDFVQKADSPEDQANDPMARDRDEVRKFRMPARSSVVRPACVFLEEGAEPLG